ncbi:MAG: glycoside hydrolase [Anaerolineae bacterium]|nr:glycoside hydrolase [Anaerolineae bacterium]
MLLQRRDGRVIGWAADWNQTAAYGGRPGQPVGQTLVRAAAWEALRYGPREMLPALIHIPYMVPLVGDDFKTRYTPALWGKMVEDENGYLLQAAYPVLVYGRMPRLWDNQVGFAPQYRTIVLYSQDDGATWHYLATVAAPDRYPLPPQAEGYCEPDLLYFGDGHLLCVMRSGGNPAGFMLERCTPLMASHSFDGGLTWEPPYPIASYGVKPVLLLMSNGLVVCLAGRPGFFVLFSADQGRTWSTPYWISQQHGPWGESPSGYGALLELEPGVLAVSYDEYVGSGTEACMVSKLRRYQVELR